MAEHGKKGAAKVKRLGRNAKKILHYYSVVWAPRKVKHMLQNNGFEFARAWCQKHECTHLLR